MGLNQSYLSFIESSVRRALGEARGYRMLELGDQVISDPDIAEATGKEYFVNRGFEHVSVDFNGLHGAIVRDLTKPEEFTDWHHSFDVLTNSGTTEHVEPFESQYECFGILHECIKVGGIAVHLVPDVDERDEHGAWTNHRRYYYSHSFFALLAKECEYDLLESKVINGLRCVALRKTRAAPFMSDRVQLLACIEERDVSDKPNRIVRKSLRRMGIGKLLRRSGLR